MSNPSPAFAPPPSYTAESPMLYPPPAPHPHPRYDSSSPDKLQPFMSSVLPGPKSLSTATTVDPHVPTFNGHSHDNYIAVNIGYPTLLPGPDTTNTDIDERRCRICLETDDNPRSKSGKLISPCLCKGSSRYIHLSCLQKWRNMSPRKESAFSCDTCHYHYSFSRPWIAGVLGNPWFLRIVTLLMFLMLYYGAAWVGRELNAHGIWKWKQRATTDSDKPMRTVLGLDWMDWLWGLAALAVVGVISLIVRELVALCDHGNTGGNGCGGGGSFCLLGLGGSADGEGLLIVLVVALVFSGIVGMFGVIYMAIAAANRAVLDFMQETILDVK